MGEELTVAGVTESGLIGDRAYALIDNTTGKIASAKNPRKWARLLTAMSASWSPHAKIPAMYSPLMIALHNSGFAKPRQTSILRPIPQGFKPDLTSIPR